VGQRIHGYTWRQPFSSTKTEISANPVATEGETGVASDGSRRKQLGCGDP